MSTQRPETVPAPSPGYCPRCERVFRDPPYDYACPFDRAPIIDVGDPLPPGRLRQVVPVAVLALVALVTGIGLLAFGG